MKTKLAEAKASHRAGTYLAAVLVARAALTDALDHVGAPPAQELLRRLNLLT